MILVIAFIHPCHFSHRPVASARVVVGLRVREQLGGSPVQLVDGCVARVEEVVGECAREDFPNCWDTFLSSDAPES